MHSNRSTGSTIGLRSRVPLQSLLELKQRPASKATQMPKKAYLENAKAIQRFERSIQVEREAAEARRIQKMERDAAKQERAGTEEMRRAAAQFEMDATWMEKRCNKPTALMERTMEIMKLAIGTIATPTEKKRQWMDMTKVYVQYPAQQRGENMPLEAFLTLIGVNHPRPNGMPLCVSDPDGRITYTLPQTGTPIRVPARVYEEILKAYDEALRRMEKRCMIHESES